MKTRNPVENQIGATVKALRKSRGLIQSDFHEIGISAPYLSLIENGQRKPTPGVLKRLAEFLGVEISAFTTAEKDDLSAGDRELSLAFKVALKQGALEQAEKILGLFSTNARNSILFQLQEASLDCENGNFVSAHVILSGLVATRFVAASPTQKMEIVTLFAEAADQVNAGLTGLLELYRLQILFEEESCEFRVLVACLIAARLSNAGDSDGAIAQLNSAKNLLGAESSGGLLRNIFWTASNISMDSGDYASAAEQAVLALLNLRGNGSSITNLDINLMEIEAESPLTEDEKLLETLHTIQAHLLLLASSPDNSLYIAPLSVLELKILVRLGNWEQAQIKFQIAEKLTPISIDEFANLQILGAKIDCQFGRRIECRNKLIALAKSLRGQPFSGKKQRQWVEIKHLAILLKDLELVRDIVEIEVSKVSQPDKLTTN